MNMLKYIVVLLIFIFSFCSAEDVFDIRMPVDIHIDMPLSELDYMYDNFENDVHVQVQLPDKKEDSLPVKDIEKVSLRDRLKLFLKRIGKKIKYILHKIDFLFISLSF